MPRGGARPGAGRPKGSKDKVRRGSLITIHALKIAKRRLGPNSDANTDELAVLEYVFQRVGQVLKGKVSAREAPSVLMAARLLADALAGPQVQKIEQTLAQEHAQLSIMLEEEEDRALEREKNRAPLQLLASSPEVAAEVSKPVSPEHVVPGNTGQLAGVPPDGAA